VSSDPFVEFKNKQRQGWPCFVATEIFTTPVAAHLVRFAGVTAGQAVLDAATGTGVVAINAALQGARVTGLDLTPELLARARENAALAGVEVAWHEGDVESLPFPDQAFDVVLSEFGHMFAPRPEVATRELLRVLKPGGRLAFATWPPEHLIGGLFNLISRYAPPPPGVAPTALWGDPNVVRERLAEAVRDLFFQRGIMTIPALSTGHYRERLETTSSSVIRLTQDLTADPDKLATFRHELDALIAPYCADNLVRQEYLLSRAIKA
jgi:SAM-dependent methyltransferase